MHRTQLLTTKNYPVQDVNGTEVEKPSTKRTGAGRWGRGTVLLTDLDYQKEIGLLFHNRCWESTAGTQEIPRGPLLYTVCKGQNYQQTKFTGRTTKDLRI